MTEIDRVHRLNLCKHIVITKWPLQRRDSVICRAVFLLPMLLFCLTLSIFLTLYIFLQVIELHDKDGQIKLTCLGNDLVGSNQQPQYAVPPNVWFGAFPTKDFQISSDGVVSKGEPRDAESHYSLVGCTCAPAFQFEDFEFAERADLISRFPKQEQLISLLTFEE